MSVVVILDVTVTVVDIDLVFEAVIELEGEAQLTVTATLMMLVRTWVIHLESSSLKASLFKLLALLLWETLLLWWIVKVLL